jgi:hypothetical protein
MHNLGAKCLVLAAAFAVVAGMSLNGCASGEDVVVTGKGGGAGSAGKGGTTGSAGAAGTNTAGTGGSTSTAGTGGSATAGRGGNSSAGTTGGGGTGGGSAGANGGLPCPGVGTFDNDMQSFQLNTYMDPAAGAAINLAVTEAGTPASMAWDGSDGDPLPGSFKVIAPFTDYKQFVDIQRNYGSTMLKNWTGMKLHVRAKVDDGGGNPSPMNPMGVQPYVNTGSNYGGYCGKYVNLKTGGGWNDYVLDLGADCTTSGADPSMVIAFGVSFQAGSGSDGDGGVNPMKPMTATIHVDSFWVEGSCGGTGGTGGGTAGTGGGTAGAGGGTAGATAGTGGATAGTGGATAGTGGGTAGATAGTGGGAAGTGGTSILTLATFDATNATEGFGLNIYNGTRAGGNLGIPVDGGALATSAWSGTQGYPSPPGSLVLSIPFDAYGQFVDEVKSFGSSAVQDWSARTTLNVRFKVTAGLNPDPSYPAIAQAYAQSPTYAGPFGYTTIAQTTDWQIASVALHPTPAISNYDPAMIIQFGLIVRTGTGTMPDGGAPPSGPPTQATVYIDSFWLE